jgi:hypothetical protein
VVEILAENRHFRLTLDAGRWLVVWVRTAVPYDALEEFEDVSRATVLGLLHVDRPTHKLLVDLREGPMRNDEGFEAAAHRFRRDVHHGFARSAVLVRSQAGRLQIVRHEKESPLEGASPPTFLDEGEALGFLGVG